MRKNPWLMLFILILVFGALFSFLMGSSMISLFGGPEAPMKVSSKNSILKLELEGVIMDGKKFLRQLKKYREDKHIKAIVIEVNSPGGVVGPSQEIHQEILRTREEFKKPVVVVSVGLMASGAYYAAVAADHIVVAPGTLMGSIGVIMEFINLEKLYDWAKVNRYTITTGKYKDSGAEYRKMRDDERQLFQEMINEVWGQFKDAVAEGRKLKPEFVNTYADGRIFTGQKGVELGFADQVGTTYSAYKKAAELAEMGDEYDIFEPPKRRPSFFELVTTHEEDDEFLQSPVGKLNQTVEKLLKTELANKPLYLLPGSW